MSKTVARVVAAWLLAALAGGCATRQAPPPAPVSPVAVQPAEACALLPVSRAPSDTLTVALTEPVDPRHAPSPRNESERLLFAQLYETLIRVDCTGQPYPDLAQSWSVDTSGRRWSFTVRHDARFWDGTPVTARDVLASWQARGRERDGEGDSARTPLVTPLAADSVVVVDDTTLTVVLHGAHREMPSVFASPDLAVTQGGGRGAWPMGTGVYRVDELARADESAATAVDPATGGAITVHAPPAARALVLDVRAVPESDARDALDGGADLLVTSAPAVLGYAATRPDFVSVPLPWDHTYVLLSPTGGARDAEPAPHTAADTVDARFRAALARDAVRAEAGAAEGPYWWRDGSACVGRPAAPRLLGDTVGAGVPPAPTRTSVAPQLSSRIVYLRGDRVARDLADRLVALAAISRGDVTRRATALVSIDPTTRKGPTGDDDGAARLIATGLSSDVFAAALHAGRDVAYVVGLRRRALAPCAHISALALRAPWLAARAIVPLVDTRARLIARRSVGGVTVDWDGTLRISTALPSTREPRP